MAYDGRVMRLALERFDEDRRARSEEQERRRERVFARQPRLREIEGELRSTMSRIIAQALRQGTDPVPAVERLRDENLRLQEEKRTLLEQMGLPADYLEEKPVCPICNDTGYHAGGVCRCLRAYYAKEQQKELSRMLDLGNQSFDTFELEWYSDQVEPGRTISYQENMKWVYDHIFERFESQKFGREDEAQEDVERVLECDLLILDDLGTEMTTAFVQSALYQILNTRLMEKRSTIVNTNLTPTDLARRYTPQIASRIEGEYQILPFLGQDIRKLKKSRQKP